MHTDLHGRRTLAALGGMLALALSAPAAASAQTAGIDVGAHVPNPVVSSVPLGADKPHLVELRALLHGPTLIIFWAIWCPSCEDLEDQLSKLYQDPGKSPPAVQIIRVAVTESETPAAVQAYAARHRMPGAIVYDAHAADHDLPAGVGEAAKAFAVPAVSYIVLVDKSGHVLYSGIGSGQDLRAILAKAK